MSASEREESKARVLALMKERDDFAALALERGRALEVSYACGSSCCCKTPGRSLLNLKVRCLGSETYRKQEVEIPCPVPLIQALIISMQFILLNIFVIILFLC